MVWPLTYNAPFIVHARIEQQVDVCHLDSARGGRRRAACVPATHKCDARSASPRPSLKQQIFTLVTISRHQCSLGGQHSQPQTDGLKSVYIPSRTPHESQWWNCTILWHPSSPMHTSIKGSPTRPGSGMQALGGSGGQCATQQRPSPPARPVYFVVSMPCTPRAGNSMLGRYPRLMHQVEFRPVPFPPNLPGEPRNWVPLVTRPCHPGKPSCH